MRSTFSSEPHYHNNFVAVDITLIAYIEFNWKFLVCENYISPDIPCLINLPSQLTQQNFKEFCTAISKIKVCEGNVDVDDVLGKKLEVTQTFVNNIGEVTAVVETHRHRILKKGNFKIIRNTNCNYLVKDVLRCEKCSSTRSTLRAIRSTKVSMQNPTSPDSNINYRFLSKTN